VLRYVSMAILVGASSRAHAQCPASEPIAGNLNCQGSISGYVSTAASTLTGYTTWSHPYGEDVYTFTCSYTGVVSLSLTNLRCDLDLFVLPSSCAPAQTITFGVNALAASETVQFTCQAGQTYYVSVEKYDSDLYCTNRQYQLDWDLRNGIPCVEDCTNGLDDDRDGATDCSDSQCATQPICCDDDRDGYRELGGCGGPDCDDRDATINPGSVERCNQRDDNCDGGVDVGAFDALIYYRDADGDAYGLSGSPTTACSQPGGYATQTGDCDDSDASVRPGGLEVCNLEDDDCDGNVDEQASDAPTWFLDRDADGWGTTDFASLTLCAAPAGYANAQGDCDDLSNAVYPGAAEPCDGRDNDCDGAVDEEALVTGTSWFADADRDGAGDPFVSYPFCDPPPGFVDNSLDCDDSDPLRASFFEEVPYDGVDQDCVGGDLDDVDGDGFRADAVGGSDCNDQDVRVNPSAVELFDGRDEDCDGAVDEGTEGGDDDGDGFTELGGDCDDALPHVRPGGIEVCDGRDGDCDGPIDEGTECADDDGDGYTELLGDCHDADPRVSPGQVEDPSNGLDDDCDGNLNVDGFDQDGDGVAAEAGDCDDAWSGARPGLPELADGADNDCDGAVDDGTAVADDDGDGYAEAEGDCHDADPSISPAGVEIADGRDNDCSGQPDDGTEASDDDGDGASELRGDCDDTNPEMAPGRVEVLDGFDNDCDGLIDNRLMDRDGDGFTMEDGDCSDVDGFIFPGNREFCDGVDNDCDDEVDEGCGGADVAPVAPASGCGCASGSPGALGAAWVGALTLLARRRRTAA
jgi:MYXO-CTERM domain-containing protein